MTLFHLIDGTEKPVWGRALTPAFMEHAKYQRMQVKPEPGSLDEKGFRTVRLAEGIAYNHERGQVNAVPLIGTVLDAQQHLIGQNTIILTELDMYEGVGNWCFGVAIPDERGGEHIGVSTYRMQDDAVLSHIVMHEIGHVFGAARRGRQNTEENLGSHCTNPCVMEQRLTVRGMEDHMRSIARQKDKFCYDCQDDLRAYATQNKTKHF